MSLQTRGHAGRFAPQLFRGIVAASLLLGSLGAGVARADTLLVFGDSLSDTGRVWAVSNATLGLELPPSGTGLYWEGRFSNGPVAVEVMAQSLGLTLDSQAWGGALTGRSNLLGSAGPLGHSGMLDQVDQWLAQTPTVSADTQVVLWGGLNDLVLSPEPATVTQALNNLHSAADTLIQAGARQLLLPGVPDLALTPMVNAMSPTAIARYQDATAAFNTGLSSLVAQLSTANPEVQILGFDSAAVIAQAAAETGWDTRQACVQGGFWGVEAVCDTPDTHLFWDGTHFSATAHLHVGLAMAQAVPEPHRWLLMVLGLPAVVLLGRAQSRRANKAPA